jgi:hypothetical protein
MVYHSWNDSWLIGDLVPNFAFHGVSLSWRCLSVCKDCAIESLNNAVNDWRGSITVHILLFGIDVEDFVERELEGIF